MKTDTELLLKGLDKEIIETISTMFHALRQGQMDVMLDKDGIISVSMSECWQLLERRKNLKELSHE